MKSTTINFTSVLVLLVSPLILIISPTWLIVWALMEINVMAFTSFKANNEKEGHMNNVSAILKYFLIQSVASAFILLASFFVGLLYQSSLWKIIFVISLMLKIASVPLHHWFVDVNKYVGKIKSTILMTWQKVIPIIILMLNHQSNVGVFTLLCAVISPIEGINTKKILEIMSLSSVFNNSWTMAATWLGTLTLVLFTVLYWYAVMTMMIEMFKQKSVTSPTKNLSLVSLSFLLNLSGLPPTTGFLAKWVASMKMMANGFLFQLAVFMLMASFNVFIYMRMNLVKFLNVFVNTKKSWRIKKNVVSTLTLLVVFLF